MELENHDTIEAKMKPCPFCGGGAYLRVYMDESLHSHADAVYTQAGCAVCDMELQPEEDGDRQGEDSLRLWNTRAGING